MNPDFIFERNGRQVVLYRGLLDAAHELGLKSIRTTLLQAPSQANADTAIVSALVELTDGRTFSGIGDCSPANAGRVAAQAITRMAETRAKARALRDAINIGAVSLEELADDDDDHHEYRASQPHPPAVPRPAHQAPPPSAPAPIQTHTPDLDDLAAVPSALPTDQLARLYANLVRHAHQVGVRPPSSTPPPNALAAAAATLQRQIKTKLAAKELPF